jgi:gluconate 5-dehydrogenase
VHPLFDLTGRIALITGSSRGIGLAMARALAGSGARVVLNGRDPQALAQTARMLATEGITAGVCAFDVTDESTLTDAIAAVERDIGPIDILINNSGINLRRPLEAVGPTTGSGSSAPT